MASASHSDAGLSETLDSDVENGNDSVLHGDGDDGESRSDGEEDSDSSTDAQSDDPESSDDRGDASVDGVDVVDDEYVVEYASASVANVTDSAETSLNRSEQLPDDVLTPSTDAVGLDDTSLAGHSAGNVTPFVLGGGVDIYAPGANETFSDITATVAPLTSVSVWTSEPSADAVDDVQELDGGDDVSETTERAEIEGESADDMDDESSGGDVPSAPTGGAVVGVGAIAAAAVLRSTPLLAGSASQTSTAPFSLPSLSSLFERVPPLLFPLRYSRYDDSDPLEHEARERVYEIVNRTPGSYLSEVSEVAELPLSTTRHHIRVLEREGLVSGVKLRGKRRFYPAHADGLELAAALNDESTASIIDAITRLGAASVSDLAEELGRDPSTISYHLQRLEEDDIVTRERRGRAVVSTLSAEARTALEPDAASKPGEPGITAGRAD